MKSRSGLGWKVGLLALMLVIAFASVNALAQQTPAGTQISNQAVAQYTDTGGIERTTNSNIVYVTVKQIAGVAVSPSDAATVDVLANQTVHYSFSVTNTGNGPDSFTLNLADPSDPDNDLIVPESLDLYRDINGNGVIDAGDTEVTSIGPIPAGETAHLIARVKVPSSAEAGKVIQIQLSADSGVAPVDPDPVVSADSAVVTFKVVTAGVLSSTLQAQSNYAGDRTSVAPSGEITYTITSLNQGMQEVDNGKVTLEIPDGTTFKDGSLKVNGVQVGPDPSFPYTLTLPTVHGGQAATVEYSVTVNSNQEVGYITNQVEVQVGESGTPIATNQVQTRVVHVAGVELEQGSGDHQIDPTNIGETYEFLYTVKNSGNGPDQIYINVADEKGWTIAVYGPNGVTELPKQGGRYTVGNLPADGSADFVVKVTVPTSQETTNEANNVEITATSGSDPSKSDTKEAILKNIMGAGVTVSAEDSVASGEPGTVVEYTVDIRNDGPATDLFDLSTEDVPEGYIVEFFDEGGNPISDISIGGGGTEKIKVRVTIPSDAEPTDPESFDVIVTSQNNSDEDDSVTLEIGVSTVVAIEIAPNRTGAANRGGFTTYTVRLTNLGNDLATVNLTTEGTERLVYVFLDADNPTTVHGSTHQETLGAGASTDVMIRVDVPSHVAVGTVETARIVATVGTSVTDSATITTEVLGGQLQLQKVSDVTEAAPGETVKYTITAKNISVGALTDVVIYEKVPEHTTFESATADDDFDIAISYSADNGSGWEADPDNDVITDVKWELDNDLGPNAEVEVTITVKVK